MFEGGRLDLFFTTYCACAENYEKPDKHAHVPIVLYFTHQKARRGHPEDFPQSQEEPLDLFFIVYSAHPEKHKAYRIA